MSALSAVKTLPVGADAIPTKDNIKENYTTCAVGAASENMKKSTLTEDAMWYNDAKEVQPMGCLIRLIAFGTVTTAAYMFAKYIMMPLTDLIGFSSGGGSVRTSTVGAVEIGSGGGGSLLEIIVIGFCILCIFFIFIAGYPYLRDSLEDYIDEKRKGKRK